MRVGRFFYCYTENIAHTLYKESMSEAMMPIPMDALYYRTLLFELSKPVIMSAERFNEVWPFIMRLYDAIANFRGNNYFHRPVHDVVFAVLFASFSFHQEHRLRRG